MNNQKDSIGLRDLIEQVKQELLTSPSPSEEIPLLSVDSVELELQVTVQREQGGKIGFNVLSALSGEAADKFHRDSIQKVKITLSPLIEKEKLLALYLKQHPEDKEKLVEIALDGGLKNPEDAGQGF
jgi:hypothetical protein